MEGVRNTFARQFSILYFARQPGGGATRSTDPRTRSLLAHKLEVPVPRINRRLSVRRIELVRLLSIDRALCCADVSFPPHRIYPAC